MTHPKKQENNLSLAVLFICVISFFASISILFKIFFLIKESNFDTKHSFNVEVRDATNINVISFSPAQNSISVLEVDEKVKTNDIGSLLELPIDARINLFDDEFDSSHIPTILIKSSFAFSRKLENMTVLDAFRLSLFARSVSGNSLVIKKLPQNLIDSDQNLLIESSFKDSVIDGEKKAIEIVNATDVFGLGARLATFVTNIGGDVILVSTREREEKSKIIYSNKQSYTVERLSKYLNFPKEKTDKKSVADVIIIIGQDSLEDIKF